MPSYPIVTSSCFESTEKRPGYLWASSVRCSDTDRKDHKERGGPQGSGTFLAISWALGETHPSWCQQHCDFQHNWGLWVFLMKGTLEAMCSPHLRWFTSKETGPENSNGLTLKHRVGSPLPRPCTPRCFQSLTYPPEKSSNSSLQATRLCPVTLLFYGRAWLWWSNKVLMKKIASSPTKAEIGHHRACYKPVIELGDGLLKWFGKHRKAKIQSSM